MNTLNKKKNGLINKTFEFDLQRFYDATTEVPNPYTIDPIMKNYRTAAILSTSSETDFKPFSYTYSTKSRFKEDSHYLDHDIENLTIVFVAEVNPDFAGMIGIPIPVNKLLTSFLFILQDPNEQLVLRTKLSLYGNNGSGYFLDKYFPPLLLDYDDIVVSDRFIYISLNLDNSKSDSTIYTIFNPDIEVEGPDPDPTLEFLKIGLNSMIITTSEYNNIFNSSGLTSSGNIEFSQYLNDQMSTRMAEIMEEQGITDWQNYSSSGYYLPFLKGNPNYFSEGLLNGTNELTISIEKYSEAQLTDEEKENIHHIGYYSKQT